MARSTLQKECDRCEPIAQDPSVLLARTTLGLFRRLLPTRRRCRCAGAGPSVRRPRSGRRRFHRPSPGGRGRPSARRRWSVVARGGHVTGGATGGRPPRSTRRIDSPPTSPTTIRISDTFAVSPITPPQCPKKRRPLLPRRPMDTAFRRIRVTISRRARNGTDRIGNFYYHHDLATRRHRRRGNVDPSDQGKL